MTTKLLGLKEVCASSLLSRASIYRRVQAGEFPKPVKLSPRRVAWREDELEEWKASLSRTR